MTNETDRIPIPAPPRGVLGHSLMEAAAWLTALATAALTFAAAGTAGLTASMPAAAFAAVTKQQRAGNFDMRLGIAGLIVVAALIVAGLLVPAGAAGRLAAALRSKLLVGAAVASAGCAAVFVFAPAVWWGWLTALFLGAFVCLASAHAPALHAKPWRLAGIASGLLVFILYAVQIEAGAAAGTAALRWMLLVAAIALIAGAVLVFVSPLDMGGQPPETETAGRSARSVRAPAQVARPWACTLLFALFGALFALAVPVVADYGFGEAAFALIVTAALVGWAAGFEAGPTFAPGMSRPRLTAFALVAAALLTIGVGLLSELSGKAVLTAVAAFCVGVGVRAQDYAFSRRMGVGAGVGAALLIAFFAPTSAIMVSPATEWVITTTGLAYSLVGTAGLIAGIVAVFVFPPQGAQGLGVDLVHAFRTPQGTAAEAPHADAVGPGATEPVSGPGRPGASSSESGERTASAQSGPQSSAAAPRRSSGLVAAVDAPARMSDTGLFIAFEGPDGSGKSTQALLLREWLDGRGRGRAVVTREPGGTDVGRAIRAVLLDGEATAPRAEALLFAADRAQHAAQLVCPALDGGGIVITDRYIDSSLAYQAAGRALGEEEVLALSRWATRGLVPHLTVVLDIAPEAAAARTAARGEENHLDAQDAQFRTRVRQKFLALAQAQPDRYVVVDADAPQHIVAKRVAEALEETLSRRGFAGPPRAERFGTGRGGAPAGEQQKDRGEPRAPLQPLPPRAPHTAGNQHDTGAAAAEPRVSGPGAETDGEEATTVLPGPRREPGEEATTVLHSEPGGRGAPGGHGAPGQHDGHGGAPGEAESTEDAATTVLSGPRTRGAGDAGEEPTTVLSGPEAPKAADPADAEAQDRAHLARPVNRDKLRAQAEIERRARERLRQARLDAARGSGGAQPGSTARQPGSPAGQPGDRAAQPRSPGGHAVERPAGERFGRTAERPEPGGRGERLEHSGSHEQGEHPGNGERPEHGGRR
ncbi:dTMP kinase [Brevibacterium sp. 5221]|uniref:Thymidylate kinase n=1 Tax=Brevibacterium rongguiense TaxID=2695267 RepID=A0A6N9H8B2_9MICO|nr:MULTISPECIES: dTMP kinase [Brevibacterium]MYM20203.1 dTMP kinase [Brevibacterium rongguiense]WAL39160.1 dTMP kinase [Brevibacterium sp. BRM-1]